MTAVTPAQAKRLIAKAKRTALEDKLASDLVAFGTHSPNREYQFHPTRKWRFDFCWPDCKLAVEVDGGTWSRGRHTTGTGYQRDSEKLNAANLLGWTVLRYTAAMVKSGQAAREITAAMGRT